jgi:acyl-coenzyme A thioesterase 13
MHGGAVASLVDLVGSAVIFAGGSPTTGVSLEITVSYLNAMRANVSELIPSFSMVIHFPIDK